MQIYRPTSLEEALDATASNPEALLLAGGTDVMVDINLRHLRPDTVVTLRRVPELHELDRRVIGSAVTFSRLEAGPHAALAEAARTVGSPQIRAMGTIGGNLGTSSPAGDALPFLVAAEADVILASTDGERRMPVSQFLVGPKQNALRAGEIIVRVELPEDLPSRQSFSKVGVRQAMVIAIASVCVIRADDGSTRVALGAVGPTVIRAVEAELLAAEGDLDDFQALVSLSAEPITDHRATAEYRRHAVGVIARRALERTIAA